MAEDITKDAVVPREGTGVKGKPFKTEEEQLSFLDMEVKPDASNLSDSGEEGAVKAILTRDPNEHFDASFVDLLIAAVEAQRGDLTPEERKFLGLAKDLLGKRQRTREAMEADSETFFGNAENRRQSHLLPEEEKEKVQVRVGKEYAKISANLGARRRAMEDKLKDEPQVMCIWPFEIVMTSSHGQMQPVRVSKTFSAGGYKMRQAPGANVKVPKSIAEWAENFWKSQEETDLRKKAIDTTRSLEESKSMWEQADEISKSEALPSV